MSMKSLWYLGNVLVTIGEPILGWLNEDGKPTALTSQQSKDKSNELNSLWFEAIAAEKLSIVQKII